MSAFTEGALVKKLLELNPSQQSIQTLSLWLIHHRKHHANIVKSWFKEIQKSEYIIRHFMNGCRYFFHFYEIVLSVIYIT